MLSAGSVHFKVVNFDSLPIEFCQYLEPHKNGIFIQIPFIPIIGIAIQLYFFMRNYPL